MLPQFFVIYTGNLDADPLDKGCANFLSQEGAAAFIRVWVNKGYTCHLFRGEYVSTVQKHPTLPGTAIPTNHGW